MTVDDDVPIPDRGKSAGSPGKYRFRDLQAGQSMFLPGDEGRKMEGAAWVFAHRNKDFGLTTRRVTENGVDGVRVWRYR